MERLDFVRTDRNITLLGKLKSSVIEWNLGAVLTNRNLNKNLGYYALKCQNLSTSIGNVGDKNG